VEFPSVWIKCEGDINTTAIFVGLPAKWQIRFEKVVGVKVSDETYDHNSRFHIDRDDGSFCSFVWEDSSWLAEFDAEYVEVLGGSKVTHYVLLGGDYNVEVLGYGNVEISAMSEGPE
jgi:hypothetical protein